MLRDKWEAKSLRVCVVLIAAVAMLAGCAIQPDRKETDADTVDLDKVLQQLRPGLAELSQNATNRDLRLESVTLSFQTVVTEKQGGSIGLLVFSAAGESLHTQTSTFTLKLTQIDQSESRQTSAAVEGFLVALGRILDSAQAQVAGLTTAEVTGVLKFTVVRSIGGEVDGFAIAPVSISMGAKATNSYTHSITVVIKRADQDETGAV